jgi:hypothetical protein
VENPQRQNFFRAGHAHAGVIVILWLICQAGSAPEVGRVVYCIPFSAILLSAGFFFSTTSPSAATPNRAIYLIYPGALILAAGVVILGVGLLRVKA